jgi:type I restriction enzyme S subunit
MKQGWEIKKLGDICEFCNGLWTGKKPPFQKVGIIRNTNFTKDCLLDDSEIVYLDVEQSLYKKRKLKYGDIILEKSGGGPKQPVGRVVIFDKTEGDFSFSNFTSVIRIKNQAEVDFNFLHRYLVYKYISGATEKMQSHSTGIRNLKFDDYKEISIPVPPLPEQKRIFSILNESFAAIDKAKANAEQNLKNAKELFESYLQSIFANKVQSKKYDSLDSLCELIVDCEHNTAPTQETGYPSIRTPNVGKGELILEDVNRVSYETYLKWTKRAIPKAGDLILAREAPAGNIAVIPENIEVCLGQRTVLIRPKNDKLNSKYLAYLILSKDVQEILLSHSTGATVQHVNMKDIRAFKIYDIPDLNEQNTIAQKIDTLKLETQKLEVVYQKKIANLEEFKKSILHKAFNGEL